MIRRISMVLCLALCGCGVDNLAWQGFSVVKDNQNGVATDIKEVSTERQRQLLLRVGITANTILNTSIRFNSVLTNAVGMAIDHTIYISYEPDYMYRLKGTPKGLMTCPMLALLAHEMIHIEQQEDSLFTQKYELQYATYGYKGMPYEVEARTVQEAVRKECYVQGLYIFGE